MPESNEQNQNKKITEDIEQVPFDEAESINAELHSNRTRAVATWNPEDAANFMAKAINESQKPMARALARSTVPTNVFWLIVVILTVFIFGLLFQLDKMEKQKNKILADKVNKSIKREDEETYVRVESTLSSLVNQLKRNREKETEKNKIEEKLKAMSLTLKETMAELDSKDKKLKELESAKDKVASVTDEINNLTLELDKLRLEKKKIDKLKNREVKANQQLQLQIEAQQTAIGALQKQLDAASKLAKILQGQDEKLKGKDQQNKNTQKELKSDEENKDNEKNKETIDGMM